MDLYTDEVRNFITTRDWPRGLFYTVNQKDDPAPHLYLVFYRDNWITLTYEDQMKATTTVKEIMSKLWADGIPIYTGKMEGTAHA